MARNQSTSICCFYSIKDITYKVSLEPHLEALKLKSIFHHIEYHQIENFNISKSSVDKVILQHDLILYLVSQDFLNVKFVNNPSIDRIRRHHHVGNLRLIPILLSPCRIDETDLSRIQSLPSNKQPILNKFKAHPSEIFLQLSKELVPFSQVISIHKKTIQSAWQNTQKKNTIPAYENFIKKYPFSIYSGQARKLWHQLLEKKHWENARKNSQVKTAFDYLKAAPLKAHQEEALDKIINYEEDEELIWQDAINNKQLFLFLAYKRRFPEGKYIHIANIEIEKLYKKNYNIRAERNLKFDANYLSYLAYQEMTPCDVFSLDSFRSHQESLDERLHDLHRKYKGFLISFIGVIAFLVIMTIMIFLTFSMFETNQLTGGILINIVATLGIFYLLWRILKAYEYIREDYNLNNNGILLSKRAGVLLKTSFITYDEPNINKALQQMYETEQWLEHKEQKNFGDYLLLPSEKDKLLKKLNIFNLPDNHQLSAKPLRTTKDYT